MTSDALSSNAAGGVSSSLKTQAAAVGMRENLMGALEAQTLAHAKFFVLVFNHPEKFFVGEFNKMEKPIQQQNTIQDSFLNSARKERSNITIYLMSGVKLTGRIKSFDKYSVILEAGSQEQLIFKHAISTVSLPRGGVRDYHYSRPLGPSDREQHPAEPSAPPQASTAAAQEKP